MKIDAARAMSPYRCMIGSPLATLSVHTGVESHSKYRQNCGEVGVW